MKRFPLVGYGLVALVGLYAGVRSTVVPISRPAGGTWLLLSIAALVLGVAGATAVCLAVRPQALTPVVRTSIAVTIAWFIVWTVVALEHGLGEGGDSCGRSCGRGAGTFELLNTAVFSFVGAGAFLLVASRLIGRNRAAD